MLLTFSKDSEGNKQYVEHPNGSRNILQLDHREKWVIRNPSPRLVSKYEGFLRKYANTFFFMSSAAYHDIPPYLHGSGSLVVITFVYPSTLDKYYLTVGDENMHILNCIEHSKLSELPEVCARRILSEELSIEASIVTPVEPISSWSYTRKYPLVSAEWKCQVSCFKMEASFAEIVHLILEEADFLQRKDIITYGAEEYAFGIGRAKAVIFIKEGALRGVERVGPYAFCPNHLNLLLSDSIR